MSRNKKNSLVGNIVIGLFCIAAGIFPMLASFDIGPLGIRDINGPAWLGVAAGGMFVSAGLVVMLGDFAPVLKDILGLSIILGLTAIANWVAFGVGERVCSGSFSFFGLFAGGKMTDLACRMPFGIGAVIMDGFLFYVVMSTVQKIAGGPPRLGGLIKLAEWVLITCLAPILIPFLALLIGRAAVEAVYTRLKTGSWPRNESFIRRRREKKAKEAS